MFKNTKNIILFSLFSFFTLTMAQLAPDENATYSTKGTKCHRNLYREIVKSHFSSTTQSWMRVVASLSKGPQYIDGIKVKTQEEYDDATVNTVINMEIKIGQHNFDLDISLIIQRTLANYAIGFIEWFGHNKAKALFNEISIIPAKCFSEKIALYREIHFGGYILKQYHYDEQLIEALSSVLINIYGEPAIYLRIAHMLETQEATLKRQVISGEFTTNLYKTILNGAIYYAVCDKKYIRGEIGVTINNYVRYKGAIKVVASNYSGCIELESIQDSSSSMTSLLNATIAYKIKEWLTLELGGTILLNAPCKPLDVKITISLEL